MYPRSNCIPSTKSYELETVLESSIVTTPSPPTFIITYAINFPISLFFAERVATSSIFLLSLIII